MTISRIKNYNNQLDAFNLDRKYTKVCTLNSFAPIFCYLSVNIRSRCEIRYRNTIFKPYWIRVNKLMCTLYRFNTFKYGNTFCAHNSSYQITFSIKPRVYFQKFDDFQSLSGPKRLNTQVTRWPLIQGCIAR